ncbi:Cysteine-rich RLK (Receptor-like kinase) protein [Quillaja saponaria]|uniref:Cysteine-rich RLK (Receptor-like kinase) protein n=1 Tax=Quillaja saponaria TaxID=32244 RepID=A0AAD7QE77_QUISA|nr:Cysteine-rich RLK (Receptor-like kinase) protein [Quillaja saponaria]
MASKLLACFLLLILMKSCSSATPQSWVRAGYYYSGSEISASDIKATLFTHLICAFAYINSSTYKLSINSSGEQKFSTFTNNVKRKNPSVITLLSIWAGGEDSPIFFSMINKSSSRESFIESSIQTARLHGFQGLDLCEVGLSSATDMANLGTLFNEWRAAVTSEARSSSKSELLLVMAGKYLPALDSVSYPIESMLRNLDWVHLGTYDYYIPRKDNITGLHAALYGPPGRANTDYGIKEWKRRGFVSRKLVLGLPYHGFAWTLVNPNNNSVGVPASGPAFTQDGFMAYKLIKSFIRSFGNGADSEYKATYVVNLFTVATTWINFDDVEAIKTKVSYAKNNGLLGYNVFQVGNDDNWVLSQAALEEHINHDRRRLLIIILIATSMVILLLGTIMCYLQSRVLKSRGITTTVKRTLHKLKINMSVAGNTDRNCSDPQVYKYSTIRVATNNFSDENKIGEGGFGTVYKGKLRKGQDIAVKRLSKTSNQGLEEFKNEVTLTARLQHVNLVNVLGYCTEREEKMLIYELMPNKSLDLYLFDPNRGILLDWTKRVNIIEGVTQGLLYLQEYSKFTIVHRDIKSGNILLDHDMNPKITDFGMARIFRKDELEANTGRIVGTYGYVPPEYVRKGIYSMKYDVYSFGVLLLQIISGKRTSCYYGTYKNLNLLEYAYELWRQGKGKEFMDPSLDDSTSPCKIMRCMQVALLCVQENPVDRPSMLDVSSMLKNEIAAISTPKKPAFSIKRDEEEKEEETCMLGVKFSSLNDVTISQVEPR